MVDLTIRKPIRHAERLVIFYDKGHWELLMSLRAAAIELMEVFDSANMSVITHGSVARGDVTISSDIDIFADDPPSSFAIETALERSGFKSKRRYLVQATPYYAAKGYIEVNEQQTVSFPLMRMRHVEREFYRFGGGISLKMLKAEKRVPGVDKRLMLIEPTETGHVESSIVGQEEAAARVLDVSSNTVFDRVHALLRRDEIGRTGVFLDRELGPDETFESALKRLVETRPEVRRRLKSHDR
ncbi:MAG: nucleotidyltransferase domain-containing protein [Candidatus Bathyarchaeota archaeon]|nr:nucleotidyltransferase domain-containing protein [Candidatus Bathyarchaeota archaeon]